MSFLSKPGSASLAKARLVGDQALRPISDQRARLEVMADRLQRAARVSLMEQLASRVRKDPRFAPLLGRLVRMSLDA